MACTSSHIESHQKRLPEGSFTNIFVLLIPLFFIFLLLPPPILGVPFDFACPDGCFCDHTADSVDCSERGLQSLSIHLSDDTRVLMCQNNNFQKIDQYNFNITNLRSLRKLSLANSAIKYVSSRSFHGLVKLAVLDLSNNFLNHIPHDISFLKYLNQLDLSRNEIRSITRKDFHNKSRLEVLSVPHNLLKLHDAESFSNLKYLQVLYLQNNSISNIISNSFLQTISLEELDLSHNQIGLIDDPSIPSLVNVGDWFQTTLPCSSPNANCPPLDKLVLSNNKIQGFRRGAFDVLTSLRTLDIQSNEISHLENDVFQNVHSLEVLQASNNQLETLPLQLFKQTDMLLNVDFSFNFLTDIPDGIFSTNTVLETVQLANNQLENLDWLAHSSPTIRELYLANNLIGGNAESTFQFCEDMQIIDLQYNLLTKFPRLWNMTRLTSLDLAGNQIYAVLEHTRFDRYQDLTFLSIADNQFDTLSEVVFSSLPPVQEFAVYNNPFVCDCRLLWLDDIYISVFEGFEVPPNLVSWVPDTFESMVCDRPKGWQGVSAFDKAAEFECSSFADVKGIVSLVLGWMIFVLTIVVVYWRWKVRKAKRHMRAWKPNKRHKKLARPMEPSKTGNGATVHTVNGRVKTYSPSQHEYVSHYDRDLYHSVTNSGERDYSPACVCLLQQEEYMQSSDLLTETTV